MLNKEKGVEYLNKACLALHKGAVPQHFPTTADRYQPLGSEHEFCAFVSQHFEGNSKFKSNEMVTHPKAKFAFTGFCTEVNLNLTAHAKLDLKIFQGRAENLNITNRAFSHDVTSDILMA